VCVLRRAQRDVNSLQSIGVRGGGAVVLPEDFDMTVATDPAVVAAFRHMHAREASASDTAPIVPLYSSESSIGDMIVGMDEETYRAELVKIFASVPRFRELQEIYALSHTTLRTVK
jgi:F0F1-type ATP synthase beta subunit